MIETNQLNQVNFTNSQLYRLILPLIVEQFLGMAVGLADSIMVASVGEAAVSAVSLVDSINILLFYGFSALATGGAVVCGQFLGRRDVKRANDSMEQLLVLILALAVGITAIVFACKYLILNGLFGKIEPDVKVYANTYFNIVETSIPFMAVYTAGAAIFRVIGNSAVSMKVSMIMNGINVSGNAILIFGFNRGVEGVAIPTLISRAFAALVIIFLLCRPKYILHIKRPFSYRFHKQTVRNILKIAIPSGLESSLFHLGKILLLSVVSAFGTASITANAIGNTVGNFQCLPASAIGVGMITVVSQCIGAGDFEKARAYTRKLMKWAYVSMFAINVVLFLLQPYILNLYHISAETMRLASIILWLHAGIGVVLWPLAFTLPQSLKAAGDTTYVMLVAVASMWTFRIGTGVLFAKILGLGVLGIWYAMFIDWVCRIVFIVVRYRGDKWEDKFVR